MDEFIARANGDHFLDLLNQGDLAPEKRATIVKLLVAEEDKLGHHQEQLEFAETRAARGRQRLAQLRNARDGSKPIDRACADGLIATFEITQRLLEEFCDKLLAKVMHSRL